MKINWNFTVNILILVIAVLLIIIQHDCVKPFLKNLRRPDYKSSRQTDNNKSEQTNKEQIAESPVVVNSPVVKPAAEFQDIKFPDNFLFGTAYSDFQIAGINKNSDWYEHANNTFPPPINRYSGITNQDLIKQFKEDFSLGEKIGVQILRISMEWSRFEPKEGQFDMEAVKTYREIFSSMRSNNIEPMICLNHFPLPNWFVEQGCWENIKAPYYYSRYAEFLAKNLGAPLKIKWWLTFNEPQVILAQSYAKGQWPPYKRINGFYDEAGTERIIKAASLILDAHRLSYRTIHRILDGEKSENKIMVGWASAPNVFYPQDPDSPLDKAAVNFHTALLTMFLDSAVGNADRDFIGLNYYGRSKIKFHVSLWPNMLRWLSREKPFAFQWEQSEQRKQGDRPKEFYPQALYDLIMKFKDSGAPIMITENGLDDAEDKFREEFIVIHLKAVHDAIRDGANIIGYQYWSLSDTWEPADGRFASFGLTEKVDGSHKIRQLRPSAVTYGQIIKTHKISKELLEKHKELLLTQEN